MPSLQELRKLVEPLTTEVNNTSVLDKEDVLSNIDKLIENLTQLLDYINDLQQYVKNDEYEYKIKSILTSIIDVANIISACGAALAGFVAALMVFTPVAAFASIPGVIAAILVVVNVTLEKFIGKKEVLASAAIHLVQLQEKLLEATHHALSLLKKECEAYKERQSQVAATKDTHQEVQAKAVNLAHMQTEEVQSTRKR
jgi:hypothetical protein